MFDFPRLAVAVQAGAVSGLSDAIWYALSAAAVWLVFYVVFRRRLAGRKVVPRDPTRRQIGREVLHSLRSVSVFAVVTALVVYAAVGGYTRLYGRVELYGWPWLVASFFVAVAVHDCYFYWTHRLMHHRRFYRLFHRTHHLSVNPTPWAAYAFSVPEAVVQAGIGPLLVFTIPMHGGVFAAFMAWQVAFNVLGHGGYEIFPRRFLQTRAGRVLNTPTHHALHHEKFTGNFGLYFNVWDRAMRTNHPDYQARFERAAGGTPVPPCRADLTSTGGPSA